MNRFQEPYNEKYFLKKTFEGVFRTQGSIFDGTFLWIYLTAYYFCNKVSTIDLRLGYIEIFKVKLRWSKSSWLLQRIAFLVLYWILPVGAGTCLLFFVLLISFTKGVKELSFLILALLNQELKEKFTTSAITR